MAFSVSAAATGASGHKTGLAQLSHMLNCSKAVSGHFVMYFCRTMTRMENLCCLSEHSAPPGTASNGPAISTPNLCDRHTAMMTNYWRWQMSPQLEPWRRRRGKTQITELTGFLCAGRAAVELCDGDWEETCRPYVRQRDLIVWFIMRRFLQPSWARVQPCNILGHHDTCWLKNVTMISIPVSL